MEPGGASQRTGPGKPRAAVSDRVLGAQRRVLFMPRGRWDSKRVPLPAPGPVLPPVEWEALAGRLGLTPRQSDVVHLVLQARSNRRIAAALGIEATTVRMHLRDVFRRLGVRGRLELVLRVLQVHCEECRKRMRESPTSARM